MWPSSLITDLFNIELPIIQAPMAGSTDARMAVAVSEAGGLGSLPCALLGREEMQSELASIRRATTRPINVNFFCHPQPAIDEQREKTWKERLSAYYAEFGIDPRVAQSTKSRSAFDSDACERLVEFAPEVVSFHFGLPESRLVARIKSAGAKVISSATTVREAKYLESEGCDAVIAQGYEAGGHRGSFLTSDMSIQVGTLALVPQIVDAIKVPVIAAGGIADGRGIAAAFALGASAVQLGTAYLFCPEAKIPALYRQALRTSSDEGTALTNLFSGRPARGILNRLMHELGPMSELAPEFPRASLAVSPLRSRAEMAGSGDFSPLWCGQSAALCRELGAAELTRALAEQAAEEMARLCGKSKDAAPAPRRERL